MNGISHTPDERFLLKLFEIASSKGNPFNQVKTSLIAQEIGQTEKSVKNIVKLLAQANFIKKGEDSYVRLTQNGLNFVKQELT